MFTYKTLNIFSVAALVATAGFASAVTSTANAGGLYEGAGSLKGTAEYAPASIWTGWYLGAHGGFSEWDFKRPDDKTSPTQSIDDGYFGGAQFGVDHELPNGIVVGLVADVSIGDLKTDTYKDGNFITVNSEIDAFGTLRARIGYAFDRFLPYLTGGAAWMAGSTTENCPAGASAGHCQTAGQYSETDDFDRIGLAYGGGFEIKMADNVSVFAEYLRLDFGTEIHDLGPKSWDRAIEIDGVDVIKAGLNYRFGDAERSLK